MDTPPLTNTLQVRSQPFLVRLDKHNKVAVLEKVKNYPLKAEDLNLAALLGALEGVDILIARGMGPRLVNALASANIRAIFTGLDSVDEAAKQFGDGKLDELQKGTCDH